LVWITIGAESGEVESGLGCWMSLVGRKLVASVGRFRWAHGLAAGTWLRRGLTGNMFYVFFNYEV